MLLLKVKFAGPSAQGVLDLKLTVFRGVLPLPLSGTGHPSSQIRQVRPVRPVRQVRSTRSVRPVRPVRSVFPVQKVHSVQSFQASQASQVNQVGQPGQGNMFQEGLLCGNYQSRRLSRPGRGTGRPSLALVQGLQAYNKDGSSPGSPGGPKLSLALSSAFLGPLVFDPKKMPENKAPKK